MVNHRRFDGSGIDSGIMPGPYRRYMSGLWALAAMAAGPFAAAEPLTIPPGLQPGDAYRLVFLIKEWTEAFRSNIAFYNDFVTASANGSPALKALNTTWRVIASTCCFDYPGNHVSAFDNLGGFFASPLYGLDGLKVADNSDDLWDGSVDKPINTDQFGTPLNIAAVWTGTLANGLPGHPLGGATPGPIGNLPFVTYGISSSTYPPPEWSEGSRARWVASDWISIGTERVGGFGAVEHPMYAVSGVLTVPIPAPATTLLVVTALAAATASRLRKPPTRAATSPGP